MALPMPELAPVTSASLCRSDFITFNIADKGQRDKEVTITLSARDATRPRPRTHPYPQRRSHDVQHTPPSATPAGL